MINIRSILFILGFVLSKVALLMYIPTIYAFFTRSPVFIEFIQSVIITHAIALIFLAKGKKQHFKLEVKEMFLTTTLVWLVACLFAALPFILIKHISLTDAFFETMSGLTTTGSTILTNLNTTEPSILLWRSVLQWTGGIGFIVTAVAILPFLNVGGMRLFHTESSEWSDKSSPRMQDVAKNIFLVYIVLTILCYFGFFYAGMDHFDAINHAFSTLSTGGFSTNDQSMAAYPKLAHWNAIIFMFLASLPFLLFVQTIKKRSLSMLFKDQQIIGFALFIIVISFLIAIWLWYKNLFLLTDSIRISFFNVINILSTTGYSLGDFDQWTSLTTLLFGILMLFGGCSGSTAGGIKIFRLQICLSLFNRQIKNSIHPQAIFPLAYNKKQINEDHIRSVVAFIMGFLSTIIIISAILALAGVDPLTALTGSITAVANVGPGMGNIIGPSGNFVSLPDITKWMLSFGMLFGRLEIMTACVLFFPSYWQK